MKNVFRILAKTVGWIAVAGLLGSLFFLPSSVYQKFPVDTVRGATFWFLYSIFCFVPAWFLVFVLRGKRENAGELTETDPIKSFLYKFPFPVLLIFPTVCLLLNALWILYLLNRAASDFVLLVTAFSFLLYLPIVCIGLFLVGASIAAVVNKKSKPWLLAFSIFYLISTIFTLGIAAHFFVGITGGV